MVRIGAIFIALCMVLIAASLGAVLFVRFGFSVVDSAVAALGLLTVLALYNAVSGRRRDRAVVNDQVASLARGSGDLARQMANGHAAYLLDVRQPAEHALAALPGAVLVPLNELTARLHEVKPEEDALLVVYCHHGIRSQSAAALLERQGFRNVVSLTGGIDAWSCEVDPDVPRY